MTLKELSALWIGVVPGQYHATPDGQMVIAALQRGQRITMPNKRTARRLTRDGRTIGYGIVVVQFTPGEVFRLDTTLLEPEREVVKKEFARLGVTGQVIIGVDTLSLVEKAGLHGVGI